MNQATKQLRIVAAAAPVEAQDFEPVAFFDGDGNPVAVGGGSETPDLGALAQLDQVTSTEIATGTIINSNVSPTAGIAGTKIAIAASTANGVTADTLQAAFVALAARVQALEDASAA